MAVHSELAGVRILGDLSKKRCQKMPHLAVRHQVQGYNRWKPVFDRFAPQRQTAGEIPYQIYHTDEDPNHIILLFEWDTMANAKAFVASDSEDLRSAMEEAGVVGEPVFFFLNAGDSGRP